MNPKYQKLQDMMKLLNEGLTREEFVTAFKEVIKIIKTIKDTNDKEWNAIHSAFKKIPDKMMSDMYSEMSKTEKKIVKECTDKTTNAIKINNERLDDIDDEVKEIKNDRQNIIDEAVSKVPTPPFLTSAEIRDRLEILPEGEKLSIQAIQDLAKTLEELDRIAKAPRAGASLISQRIRFVDDETPSGTKNGTNKDFTLARAPLAGSLKVYRGGARQRITEDYTFDTKTITFNSAPAAGEILLVDYRY